MTQDFTTAKFVELHTPIEIETNMAHDMPMVGQIYALSDVGEFDEFPGEIFLMLSEFGDDLAWNSAFFRVVEHGEG